MDPLRVVIDTRSGGISGHEARRILFERDEVHTEMATDSVIVAVIGAGAAPDVRRVLAALHHCRTAARRPLPRSHSPRRNRRWCRCATPTPAPADRAKGGVSADSLAAYPPGIPDLLPGELITPQTLDFLRHTATSPFGHVRGAVDPQLAQLRVLATTG